MNLPHPFKKFAIILISLFLLAIPSAARADVAPPINPPGSNLQPGTSSTQVRMLAETVVIAVMVDKELGSARINADFTMRNTGSSDETLAVRFPITTNDGRGTYPEIRNLVIKSEDKLMAIRRVNYPDIHDSAVNVPWAEFDYTFPAGQDKKIRVAYNVDGSGYVPYTAFYYILESGAGWKDTIGSADIILSLPYAASIQNVVMNLQIGWGETTPGGVIQGNEVRWHFDNLEPGLYNTVSNMEFVLVDPGDWQKLVKLREGTVNSPKDSEAWGALAKAYKDIFLLSRGYRTDPGGDELYQLSVQAYEKCLEFNPKDPLWHAGLAELLANRSFFHNMTAQDVDTYRALEEIRIALQLGPTDPTVIDIARTMSWFYPDGIIQTEKRFDFPWLTQTPTPVPPTPTIAPALNPQTVSGIYNSDVLTLLDGRQATFTLTLTADHSATLQTTFTSESAVNSVGTWTDNGDGSLTVLVKDSDRHQLEINYNFNGDQLLANLIPSYFGDSGPNMLRQQSQPTAPPQPATDTPTAVVVPTQTAIPPTPAPSSKPIFPFCGSAALIGVVWFARKKR